MEAGFSQECREQLEQMMARRAADFRLDSRVVALCSEDIAATCGRELATMSSVEGTDGRVLHCLQDYAWELKVRRRRTPLMHRGQEATSYLLLPRSGLRCIRVYGVASI